VAPDPAIERSNGSTIPEGGQSRSPSNSFNHQRKDSGTRNPFSTSQFRSRRTSAKKESLREGTGAPAVADAPPAHVPTVADEARARATHTAILIARAYEEALAHSREPPTVRDLADSAALQPPPQSVLARAGAATAPSTLPAPQLVAPRPLAGSPAALPAITQADTAASAVSSSSSQEGLRQAAPALGAVSELAAEGGCRARVGPESLQQNHNR